MGRCKEVGLWGRAGPESGVRMDIHPLLSIIDIKIVEFKGSKTL
jgi:hypothetical protein